MNFRLSMSGGRTNIENVLRGLEQRKSEAYEQLVNHDELHDAQNNGSDLFIFSFLHDSYSWSIIFIKQTLNT